MYIVSDRDTDRGQQGSSWTALPLLREGYGSTLAGKDMVSVKMTIIKGLIVWNTLRRWERSRLQRIYDWQFSAHYWSIRRTWQRVRLVVGNLFLRTTGQIHDRHEDITIIRAIFESLRWPFVLALGTVCALEAIERKVLPQVQVCATLLRGIPRPESTAYGAMLSTVAQVGGVFLGLYFTAVGVVASAAYTRVPSDIRSLFTREKVGNLYVWVAAFMVAVSVLLLGYAAAGYKPGFLNLVLVAILGTLTVLSFVVLGQRVFHFFDPTALAGYLVRDIRRLIRSATPQGIQWNSPTFQAHYQQQAENALQTYQSLVALATEGEHWQSGTLLNLGIRSLALLETYGQEKTRIPSDSHWFRRTQRHPEWLTTGYLQVDIALHTGTGLEPSVIPERMWFETEIETIVGHIARALLQRNDWRTTAMLGAALQQTLGVLGQHLAVEEALHIFRALEPHLQNMGHNLDA